MQVPLLDLRAQYAPLKARIMAEIESVCDSQALVLGPDEYPGGGEDFFMIQAAVAALAAIDTDEAWQAIGELATDKAKGRRSATVRALEMCPDPRTVQFLLAALDDPDVRQEAYVALLRVEPRLQSEVDWSWSVGNVEKIRLYFAPPQR